MSCPSASRGPAAPSDMAEPRAFLSLRCTNGVRYLSHTFGLQTQHLGLEPFALVLPPPLDRRLRREGSDR